MADLAPASRRLRPDDRGSPCLTPASSASLPLAAATALASFVFSFAIPALPFRDRDPVVQLLSVAPLPWREADGGSDDHGDDARPRYFYADRGAEGFWMVET